MEKNEADKKQKLSTGSLKERPHWITMKSSELEEVIVTLGKEKKTPEKIGILLRDKYGVPKAKLLGKKITQILKEKNISYISDPERIDIKIDKLRKHMEKNKHDYNAKRSLAKKLWIHHSINKKIGKEDDRGTKKII